MSHPIESPLALPAGLATAASPRVPPVLPFLLGAAHIPSVFPTL